MSGEWIDTDQMIRDLGDAGWKKINRHTWQAPNGAYFRGPYDAWLRMKEGRQ